MGCVEVVVESVSFLLGMFEIFFVCERDLVGIFCFWVGFYDDVESWVFCGG